MLHLRGLKQEVFLRYFAARVNSCPPTSRGVVSQHLTSSQLFTCFYPGLTHPVDCSTMFAFGKTQCLPGLQRQ